MRIVIIAVLIILLTAVFIFSCACDKIDLKHYSPAPVAFEFEPDDSIAFCTLQNAPVDNPDRGFRGETYITLGRDEAYPGSGEPYMQKLQEQLTRHGEQDITVLQVYVYLIEYYDKEIPQSAFIQLKDYLEYIKSKDVKILLRFAYETNQGQKNGPTTSRIESHCKQIKVFFEQNQALFYDVVYAMQMGMIGLWGEGHGSVHKHSVKRVAAAVADMVPEGVPIMVRTPQMLTQVPDELEYRFSVHDDFLVGYDHEWGMMDWEDEQYTLLLNKCKHTVTDGELPWGRAGDEIDILGVVKQCVGYGLTTLSIEHNYNEDEGQKYALEQAKEVFLDEDYMRQNNLPYNPALLECGKISAFDYLKYHLGYQLVASNLKIADGKASFMLTNYGFASPYYFDMKIYVDGKEVSLDEPFKAGDLMQFCQKSYSFEYDGGEIGIKIFNKYDGGCIRLFNDVPFEDGINVIYGG